MARSQWAPRLALSLALVACRASAKGCFAPWTPVVMEDGTQKPIGDVSEGDVVASWDQGSGRVASARVVGLEVWPAEELMEVRVESVPVDRVVSSRYLATAPEPRSGVSVSLVVTPDHPIYSSRHGGVVSMRPHQTKERYAMEAAQMQTRELLHHYLNSTVCAEVLGAWQGEMPRTVITLRLDRHHWFYAHGVRVHNKGCFLKTAEVMMADGSTRELQHVNVGDRVSSWDEAAQKPAASVVQAVPTYHRDWSELVEISVPTASFHATEDHPFWSRGRGSLVSMHPDMTRAEYDLHAELMGPTEELEGLSQEPVHISAIRRLAVEPVAENISLPPQSRHDPVEVSTLCLHPHHWFYVHGVRVHNKGCFAPWTPVMMEDGTQKPIGDVSEGDVVASWDQGSGRVTSARVVGLEVWPSTELLEVRVEALHHPAVSSHARLLAGVPAPGSNATSSLVVTPDHPIYSVLHGGPVSMRPEQTKARYDMNVAQMQRRELFHHYLNFTVTAEVRGAWWGEMPGSVVTLRLDHYHWFFTHGVRVHNKGSSGGGGGGGSGSGYSKGVYRSSSVGPRVFVTYYLLFGNRRRYGTYEEEQGDGDGECKINSEPLVMAACEKWSPDNETKCSDCIACETETCVNSISGLDCHEFLADAFEECSEDKSTERAWAIGLTVVFSSCCFCFCAYMIKDHLKKANLAKRADQRVFQNMRQRRLELGRCNGPRLSSLQFSGTYLENDETKPTSYFMNFDSTGILSGSSTDDDGTASVCGKLSWGAGASWGTIAWLESRPGVEIEVEGSIKLSQQSRLEITANYRSSNQATQGWLHLSASTPEAMLTVDEGETPCVGKPHNQLAEAMSAAPGGVLPNMASRHSGLQNHAGSFEPVVPVVPAVVVGQPVGLQNQAGSSGRVLPAAMVGQAASGSRASGANSAVLPLARVPTSATSVSCLSCVG